MPKEKFRTVKNSFRGVLNDNIKDKFVNLINKLKEDGIISNNNIKMLDNNSFLEKMNEVLFVVNDIVFHTYNFMKEVILYNYKKDKKIPLIDKEFVTNCQKVVVGGNAYKLDNLILQNKLREIYIAYYKHSIHGFETEYDEIISELKKWLNHDDKSAHEASDYVKNIKINYTKVLEDFVSETCQKDIVFGLLSLKKEICDKYLKHKKREEELNELETIEKLDKQQKNKKKFIKKKNEEYDIFVSETKQLFVDMLNNGVHTENVVKLISDVKKMFDEVINNEFESKELCDFIESTEKLKKKEIENLNSIYKNVKNNNNNNNNNNTSKELEGHIENIKVKTKQEKDYVKSTLYMLELLNRSKSDKRLEYSNIGNILERENEKIVTCLNTNIQEHYTKHLKKFVNVYYEKKKRIQELKDKFGKCDEEIEEEEENDDTVVDDENECEVTDFESYLNHETFVLCKKHLNKNLREICNNIMKRNVDGLDKELVEKHFQYIIKQTDFKRSAADVKDNKEGNVHYDLNAGNEQEYLSCSIYIMEFIENYNDNVKLKLNDKSIDKNEKCKLNSLIESLYAFMPLRTSGIPTYINLQTCDLIRMFFGGNIF